MNKLEQAYCCLTCANLPPCNIEVRNCKECCKNCGDTSKCLGSAYFDGSTFFRDYIYKAELTSSYGFNENDGNTAGYENYISTYDTSRKNPCEKNGSGQDLSDTAYFYKYYYSYNDDTTTITSDYEDCDDCPRTSTGPSSCVNGDAITETECFSPEDCYGCILNQNCSYACPPFSFPCLNPTIYRAYEKYKTEITFKNSVKLYNNKGEEVGNIIGASYDSNNPTRTWSAPGCHYFT